MRLNFRLRAMARYIRLGKPSQALFIAKHLDSKHVKLTLEKSLIEDIGLANIPLIDKLLPINNVQSAILAMSRSDKSQLAWCMQYYFYLPWSEPLPSRQRILTSMMDEPIIDILKLSSSMFWIGMDTDWWLKMGDAPVVLKLRQLADEHPRLAPAIWSLVIMHKYYNDSGWDLPHGRTLIKAESLKYLYIPRQHGLKYKNIKLLFQQRFYPSRVCFETELET